MDPETHEIFIERNVHFEESSPSLSSNPLHTSHIMETDSDNSDSDSTDLDMWDPVDRCITRSHHQHIPHAYISIVIDPCNLAQLGTPCIPVLA